MFKGRRNNSLSTFFVFSVSVGSSLTERARLEDAACPLDLCFNFVTYSSPAARAALPATLPAFAAAARTMLTAAWAPFTTDT